MTRSDFNGTDNDGTIAEICEMYKWNYELLSIKNAFSSTFLAVLKKMLMT